MSDVDLSGDPEFDAELNAVVERMREMYERSHKANIARINQLIEDADVVIRNATERGAVAYYKGVRVGLERARTVLEGQG